MELAHRAGPAGDLFVRRWEGLRVAKVGVAADMRTHAEAAVEMVRAEYGRALDFSEPTIGAVEALLNGLWKEADEADRTGGLFAKSALLFAYIGELIRTRYPRARWVGGSITPDAPPPFVRLGDIDVYPVVWCFKQLYNGPSDSVVEKYLTFRQAAADRGHDAEPRGAPGPRRQDDAGG
jgi:hypothetical protein